MVSQSRIIAGFQGVKLVRNRDKLKLWLSEINKNVEFIGAPYRIQPLTLGLEMQGIGYTNDLVLHRFVVLQ